RGNRGGVGRARAPLRRGRPCAAPAGRGVARERSALLGRRAGGIRHERVLVAAPQALHRARAPRFGARGGRRRPRTGGDRGASPQARRGACREEALLRSRAQAQLMAAIYDAVIVGGGHNGLTCAAYLARAGKRVLVLERRERVGGAALTEEVFPGFRFSVYSYVVSLLRPEIIRDLDLPRHGLHILPLASTLTPLPDGDYLAQWGDHDQNRAELAR